MSSIVASVRKKAPYCASVSTIITTDKPMSSQAILVTNLRQTRVVG